MTQRIVYLAISILFLGLSVANASIVCPGDKTIYCHDDRYYTQLTGTPIVFGYPQQMVRYVDTDYLNNCNVGYIQRRWYVDVNQDGAWQSWEGSCTQIIYMQAVTQPVTVTFPADKTYNCKEQIKLDKPVWVSGPCDVIGFSYKDDIFEIAPDACYKIIRNFTVINWCTYHPQNPDWNGQGIWTHKQVLKVVETEAPVFNQCDPVVFNTDVDCKAAIVLTKSAMDDSNCPSQLLSWLVEVDLWANGTIDYKYGFTESGQYFIAPQSNGALVSVTLPERVGVGKHKIKWAVRDQCGNFRTCNSYFEVVDKKPPTPYIYAFLTSAFRGDQMTLEIPARLFDRGSVDNCTPKSKLRFSFSNDVNDTLRVISCNNFGFQYFTIYVTDQAGNSDFAEAFMLVFDNGSCNFGFTFPGRVIKADGKPLPGTIIELMKNGVPVSETQSDDDGSFYLEEISLMNDYYLEVHHDNPETPVLNIIDFLALRDYLFGAFTLENYQFIAADVNGDRRIRANDLMLMRDIILGKASRPDWKFYVDVETITGERDLQNLSSKTMLNGFDGNFDFTAVYPGNIKGSGPAAVSQEDKLDIIPEPVENGILFRVEESAELEGLQMQLTFRQISDNPEIIVAGKTLTSGQYHIDRENSILNIMLADPIHWTQDKPAIIINGVDISGIKPSQSNLAVSGSRKPIQLRIAEASVSANPQPVMTERGVFYMNDPDLRLHAVYNIMGVPVNHSFKGGYLQVHTPLSGLYIIKAAKAGKDLTFRIIVP
jgi:hypothetical protein